MTTLLLTCGPDPRVVHVRRCGVGVRLLVRTRSLTLDRALANGCSPDSSRTLSLRAGSLISPRHRERLADRLRSVVRAAGHPVHPFTPAVPVPASVRLIRELAEAVAEVLESTEPIDARGVARLELLLRDGDSPLYADAGARLRRELQHSLDALAVSSAIAADA